MPNYIAFIDGASKGNPGPAGAGIVIRQPDSNFERGIAQFLGNLTNNQAEYGALIILLRELIQAGHYLKDIEKVDIYSDSQLLVRQLQGSYKIKSQNLIKYHLTVRKLLEEADFKVEFHHIPREKNRKADKLASLAVEKIS